MSTRELPEGWTETTIEDISVKCAQRVPRDNEEFIYIDIGSIDRELKRIDSPQHINGGNAPSRARKSLKTGDVLVSLTRPNLNAVALVDGKYDGQIASTGFEVIRPIMIESRYIFSTVRSRHFIESITGAVQGALYPAAKSSDVQSYMIALPPLAEQKIIADKLDDLLARVESIKTRLENIPEILKKFRQSVLSSALNYGAENKSFSKVKLSDICRFQNGYAFKSDCFSKDGVHQVIKLANIRDGYLFLQNSPSYISSDLFNEYDSYVPDEGDILISMTGTRFKKDYGFACLIKDSVNNFVINQRVGRFIPLKNIVSPSFLYLFIRSELFRNEFFKGETGGVNQGNVGSKHILSIDINLPSLDEQEKIAHKVDNILSFINSLENEIVDSLSRVNNLTQSILAKAFRGELTAQWREENPELISGLNSAEALLEKITAEKLAAGTIKKRAKKTSH
ncbi:restriction endonuclease subunit S [Klebsiella sp. S69]|uniref:restriction endonuclease subunit S n=1 Tax=Klebsiella sp. S69 TaxID=2767439 RepID=UPI0019031E9A|nr:restriction endonuclease subunit S [Klebsiella sp. S69]MBK0164384.1 restriction endonuclease subunit S [Klebsiella sp. S69]